MNTHSPIDIPEDVLDQFHELCDAADEGELVLVRGTNAENGGAAFLICRAKKVGDQAEVTPLAEISQRNPVEYVVLPEPWSICEEALH